MMGPQQILVGWMNEYTKCSSEAGSHRAAHRIAAEAAAAAAIAELTAGNCGIPSHHWLGVWQELSGLHRTRRKKRPSYIQCVSSLSEQGWWWPVAMALTGAVKGHCLQRTTSKWVNTESDPLPKRDRSCSAWGRSWPAPERWRNDFSLSCAHSTAQAEPPLSRANLEN